VAPHLARAQSFVLPVYERSKHGVFLLDVGLTVYDVMAAFAGVMTHKAVRRKALQRLEPLLRAEGLQGGVRYYDAMTDDGRLVLANVRGAVQAGAVVTSRTAFVEPVFKDGRLVAAKVRDDVRGETFPVACKVVVSATGPWTDETMAKWKEAVHGEGPTQTLKPSKGVHVVVPRDRLPLSQAVMMTARDGRVVFALPWTHATVIGTTDTPYAGDLAEPPCTFDDATYLCQTANDHFHAAGGPLQIGDILSTWAGIRPLVANDPGQSSYKTSREHVVTSDPRGLVAIAGGKLTTYRVMAAETVDAALKLLPPTQVEVLHACQTAQLPLPGAEGLPGARKPLESLVAVLIASQGLDSVAATHFAFQYGTEAEQVLGVCRATQAGMDPVVPGLPVLWGELEWLAREEMVLTLADLLVRRTQLYYLAGERLLPILDALARKLCAWLDYPVDRARVLEGEMVAFIAQRRVQPAESHAA
jgi:glycerol-3-phosphate dehydrogenase